MATSTTRFDAAAHGASQSGASSTTLIERACAANGNERARLVWRLRRGDRLSAVAQVTSGFAHELGSPLNVISGRASMIVASSEDERAVANAKIVIEQTRKITELLHALVRGAKRSSRTTARVAPGALAELAFELATPLGPASEFGLVLRGADAAAALAERDLREPIELDVERVLGILTLLVENAVGASPPGASVTVEVERTFVAAPSDPHAAPDWYLVFRVCDQGSGLSAEARSVLSRAFSATRMPRASDGSGDLALGLFVCQAALRDLRGYLELSPPDAATTAVSIFVPCLPPATPAGA